MTKIFPMQSAAVRQRIVKRCGLALKSEIERQRLATEISRAKPSLSEACQGRGATPKKPRDHTALRLAKARRDGAKRARKVEEALAGIKAVYNGGVRLWLDLLDERSAASILFLNIEALFDNERCDGTVKALRAVVSFNAPERLSEIDDIEARSAFSIRAAAKAALRELPPEKCTRLIGRFREDEKARRREEEDQEIRGRLFELHRRANKNRDGADKPLFPNFAIFARRAG